MFMGSLQRLKQCAIQRLMLGKKCLDLGLSPPPSDIGNAAFDLKVLSQVERFNGLPGDDP